MALISIPMLPHQVNLWRKRGEVVPQAAAGFKETGLLDTGFRR